MTESNKLPLLGHLDEEIGYRMVCEAACVFILHLSPDNVILYANPYTLEITGYAEEEFLGRDFVDLCVIKEDQSTIRRALKSVAEGLPIVNCVVGITTKNGSLRNLLINGSRMVDAMGGATGIILSGAEVSEFKMIEAALIESKRIYRTLIEHSIAAIFIIQDDRFVFANKSAEELSGYTFEEAEDLHFTDLIHPDDRRMMIERSERRLRGEGVTPRYEYRIVRKDGEIRVGEIGASLIQYNGRPAILANVIDITDRVRSEENRLKSAQELEYHKREFLRQAIQAITKGKLDILEPEEIAGAIKHPRLTVELSVPEDVQLSRRLTSYFASSAGVSGERLEGFVLAVGEAAVNAMKHAGGGTFLYGYRDGAVWVAITDRGSGMDTLVLTRAVFEKGFSTKPSLGLGYTLILEGSDRALLSTSSEGTSVVMERLITPEPFRTIA